GALGTTQWTVGRPYSSTFTITGGTAPFGIVVETGGPPGVNVTSIVGNVVTVSGTPNTVGDFNNYQISITDAAGATASSTFDINIHAAPTLGTLDITQWTANRSYTGTIQINNGTSPFSGLTQSGLPNGLTVAIVGSTVQITGSTGVTGDLNDIQLGLTDAAGATTNGTFDLKINAAPILGTLSNTQGTVNVPFTSTIAIALGTAPYGSLTQANLPNGLTASLLNNTITISGTPTAQGTFNNVQIGITDTAGATVSQTYSITIVNVPQLGALSPTAWTRGRAYTGTITVTG